MKTRSLRVAGLRTMLGLAAIVFSLSSCSSHDKISSTMKSWVGKSESELVQKWGPPTRVYKMSDGGKVLTYVLERDGGQIEGTATKDPYGVVHYTAPESDRSEATREFTLNSSGVITNWRWHGQ